jgi:hypothetical protein
MNAAEISARIRRLDQLSHAHPNDESVNFLIDLSPPRRAYIRAAQRGENGHIDAEEIDYEARAVGR